MTLKVWFQPIKTLPFQQNYLDFAPTYVSISVEIVQIKQNWEGVIQQIEELDFKYFGSSKCCNFISERFREEIYCKRQLGVCVWGGGATLGLRSKIG